MKKIVTLLVPTDFSAAAKAAAMYAAQLAVHIHAKVILLSIIEMETSETVLDNWKKLEQQMMNSAVRDMQKLLKEVKAAIPGELLITADIATGIPKSEVIEEYSRKKKVNMIVMGTRGATGLKKILSGTNTARLIAISSRPVLAIPVKAVFSPPRKMVYATDMKNIKTEIKTLTAIASLFQAEILVLHCVPSSASSRLDKQVEPGLINQAEYGNISYHQVKTSSVDKAIGKFVDDTKADVLVMFTHELGFYEKLLGKSITRTMAFQSRIPLLVYNRSKS
jgi:nucleotide-binding universal stress UspA family protein